MEGEHMKVKMATTIVALLVAMPGFVTAEENDTWSGRIGVGAIVIDSGNNLNPSGSKERLENLDSAADQESTVLPVILPEITWDAGEPQGLKLYLTTDPPIDEVGSFAFSLGGSYRLGKAGIFDTAAFFAPFEEAWENPYATGVDREETGTSKYGLRFGLNRIMGTGLRAEIVYLNDEVEDDVIGELMPELARDGSVYSLNINYSYYVGKNLELRPRVSIRKGEYDGDANSFMKYKFDFEARYRTGRWLLIPRIYYSHSDFDESNPIFDETRENDSYGISLVTTYMAPFDMKKWSVTGVASASQGDSNIDFYDTESLSFVGLMNYHF